MTILVNEENRFNDELRLDGLKWRVKNCKCKYCGAPLRLRRILYGNNPQGVWKFSAPNVTASSMG